MKYLLLSFFSFCLITSIFGQGTDCMNAQAINGTVSGSLNNSEQDYYFFQATANGVATITLTSTTPTNCGVKAEIADFPSQEAGLCVGIGTSNQLTSVVGSGCNASGEINMRSFSIVSGRYYYIRVYRFFAVAGETYSLTVSIEGAQPVTLMDQKVSNIAGKAQLSWTTASEVNNSHFVIERSLDGDNFEKIGRVEGIGHSNIQRDYKFEDNTPFSKGYYRLVQYDLDGKFEVFPIMYWQLNKRIRDVKVYMSKAQMVLEYDADATKNHELQIVNTAGQMVYEKELELVKGANYSILEDIPSLPQGIYFVILKSSDSLARTSFFR